MLDENSSIDTYIVKCEQEILTTIFNSPEIVDLCVSSLQPSDFNDSKNRLIFRVIYDLHISAKCITKNVILDFIANNEKYQFDNWQIYLDELVNGYSYDDDLKANLEIVKNASIKRHLDIFANKIVSTKIDFAKYENQIFELEKQFSDIVHSKYVSQLYDMQQVTKSFMGKLTLLRQKNEDITGTPSGYSEIDRVTNGFQPQDLIILAARPSVGKTAMALNFAYNAAKHIKDLGNEKTDKVVIFSLEMSKEQLYQRLISIVTDISSNALRSGKMSNDDWHKVRQASFLLDKFPILIDDNSDDNIIDVQSKLKQLKNKYNIKLVIIDYLQLMHGPWIKGAQMNRQQEVSMISRMLKLLARQINAPIIALAQLSRAAEQSPERSPQLSHLRESGALEQDADLVCILQKQEQEQDEVDKPIEIERKSKYFISSRLIKFIIAKHRNGELKTILMNLNCVSGAFLEISERHTNNFGGNDEKNI